MGVRAPRGGRVPHAAVAAGRNSVSPDGWPGCWMSRSAWWTSTKAAACCATSEPTRPNPLQLHAVQARRHHSGLLRLMEMLLTSVKMPDMEPDNPETWLCHFMPTTTATRMAARRPPAATSPYERPHAASAPLTKPAPSRPRPATSPTTPRSATPTAASPKRGSGWQVGSAGAGPAVLHSHRVASPGRACRR